MTIPQCAKCLKIGVSTLRRYLRQGLLARVVLPGGDQRIREADYQQFIKTHRIETCSFDAMERGPKKSIWDDEGMQM